MQDQELAGQQEHKFGAGDTPISTGPVREEPSTTPPREHQRDYAYYKQVFGNRPMPFAYLDLDLLEQNIRQIVARANGKRVRLASKSLRSVAVIRRILASDSCFQGIMCYTAQEAVYLASQGFDDLLLGYPAYNEQDIAAVAKAVAAGKGAYVGAERSGADIASGVGDIASGAEDRHPSMLGYIWRSAWPLIQ